MVAQRPLVLELGLPKVGTTALAEYFRCNGWRTSHSVCQSTGQQQTTCVECMSEFMRRAAQLGWGPSSDTAWRHGLPSDEFRKLCGPYDVFAELSLLTATACFLPQVFYARTLVAALPDACFVLSTRDLDSWVHSVQSWSGHEHKYFRGASLIDRFVDNCPLSPRNASGLKEFHRQHLRAAREALRDARCAVEVDLRTPAEEIGATLAATFNGTKPSCWRVVNSGAPRKHGGSAWRRPAS